MPTFRRIRRSIAAILLVLYLPGCQHWVQPQGVTPQEYITTKHPKQVRLTTNEASRGLRRFELFAPSVGPGDSLTGLARGADSLPVTVAFDVIERFEVRESNPTGTTGAVLGGGAVAGLVVLAIVVAIAVGVSNSCAESGTIC